MQMVAYMRLVDINKTSVINLITAIIIICQGRWRCGLREGMGEIVFHNGDYYRGQWAADNMTDGFGKFTCKTFFERSCVRHLANFD